LVIGSANFAEDQETSLRSDGKGLTLYIEGRGSGLSAAAFGGPGITGWSFLSHAVVATTDNDNDFNAVFARSGGGGSAVYGEQGNRHSHTHGVYGKSEGSGNGVLGVAASGAGVSGTSDTGRGRLFQSGSKAQVRLIPSTAASHPASGQAGDLFLDTSRRLWLCKGASTWAHIA
jgi:hypothetical protein